LFLESKLIAEDQGAFYASFEFLEFFWSIANVDYLVSRLFFREIFYVQYKLSFKVFSKNSPFLKSVF
jgi:hypothetical protein